MSPTIGRIVVYKTTEEDKNEMRERSANVADELPAVITAVWSADCVNLKVLLDGPGDLWVTSACKCDDERGWQWPVIKKD